MILILGICFLFALAKIREESFGRTLWKATRENGQLRKTVSVSCSLPLVLIFFQIQIAVL